MNDKLTAENMLRLIEEATCPYTAKVKICDELNKAGYKELDYKTSWIIAPGGKYYVSPFGTTVIAFRVGRSGVWEKIRIGSSHIDSPALRIKCGPEMKEGHYRKLNVEIYGGGIWNTWLDRPLSVAGCVCLRGENAFSPRRVPVDLKRPVCVIPNRAIHLNRTVNDGMAIKNQTDLIPLAGVGCEKCENGAADGAGTKISEGRVEIPLELNEKTLLAALAECLKVKENEILDYELYLYNAEKGVIAGLDESMITAPRIDNLSSASALLYGLIAGERKDGIDIACFYDHEEIGSQSKNGADGSLLTIVLKRVAAAIGIPENGYYEGLADAFYLSLDVAHANHPNHREVTDPTTGIALGDGVAIKAAGRQIYSTDAFSAGVVLALCEENEIPCRLNYPNSNSVGGGTVGPVVASGLVVEAADIGMPILAMHSAMETAAVRDYAALETLMTVFFS